MRLTRIILETDERLREIELLYRVSGSEEDRQNYIRILRRVVPELAKAIDDYEELSKARDIIDTEDTSHQFGGRKLSKKEGSIVDRWGGSGGALDNLFKRFNIPEPCRVQYKGCSGPASFIKDPFNAEAHNDAWAYEWMCGNCARVSAQDAVAVRNGEPPWTSPL